MLNRRKIYIGFSFGTGKASNLIRSYGVKTLKDAGYDEVCLAEAPSHTFIMFFDEFWKVFESRYKTVSGGCEGVCVRSLFDFLLQNKGYRFELFECDNKILTFETLMKSIDFRLGCPYGSKDIFRFVMDKLTLDFFNPILNKISDVGYTCSELVSVTAPKTNIYNIDHKFIQPYHIKNALIESRKLSGIEVINML